MRPGFSGSVRACVRACVFHSLLTCIHTHTMQTSTPARAQVSTPINQWRPQGGSLGQTRKQHLVKERLYNLVRNARSGARGAEAAHGGGGAPGAIVAQSLEVSLRFTVLCLAPCCFA